MEKVNKIVVYYKPTCTTSRKAIKYLQERNVDFELINYYEKPFTKETLFDLVQKSGEKAEFFLRTKAEEYKIYDFKNKNYTEDEILTFLVDFPDLINRPIIQNGNKVILARPAEKVEEILKKV